MRLAERKEEVRLRAAHAEYFTRLPEEADPGLRTAWNERWLALLEREHENLRAALRWSVQSGSALGLRLAGALYQFWYVRGYYTEGRGWLDAVLIPRPQSP